MSCCRLWLSPGCLYTLDEALEGKLAPKSLLTARITRESSELFSTAKVGGASEEAGATEQVR